MPLSFTPLHPLFAAECSGVDIAEPISPEIAAAIEAAMDRYAVLVFRKYPRDLRRTTLTNGVPAMPMTQAAN